MEDIDLLDEKYSIIEKIGKGGTSKVFLVKSLKNLENVYAAKVLKEIDADKKEKGKTPRELFENEIKILKYLGDRINNIYITNLVDSGIGEVNRKNHPKTKNRYLVLDYAEKGCLLDYIVLPEVGLDEKYSKLIFLKILKGLQACHKEKICHRDIKLENILLDDNYNPKLCDFGFADFNSDNLSEHLGTKKYACPEIYLNKPYDGFKADIFSLGVTLFTLVANSFCYLYPIKTDKYYRYIYFKKDKLFWEFLGKNGIGIGLTDDFKELFFSMVSYEPGKRPSIEQIIESKWMADVKDLNQQQIEKLEKELKDELIEREKKIKEKKENKLEVKTEVSSFLGSIENNRSGEDDIKNYFSYNLKPKYITNKNGMNTFIKIEGNLNPVMFMNILANKIKEKFKDNCTINESSNSLKFNIIFEEEEEEDENEEIPKEIEEELNKLSINEENENESNEDDINNYFIKKECIIKVTLFELNKNEYILNFEKGSGELEDYYKKFEIINNLVKSFI